MINPMRAFKKMHHDKCIEGENRFAPCECQCFVYSRMYLPIYRAAVPLPINIAMTDDASTTDLNIGTLELKRLPGWPCEDGFYAYIKD